MLLDLIKHHWRYHRTITITYLGYLILLLTVINSQNVLSFSAYYAEYYTFLDEHPIDDVFFGTTKPGTLDRTKIEEELETIETRRSIAKQALFVYQTLPNVNLSLISSENQSEFSLSVELPRITIGATLPKVYSDLRAFNMYKGEDLLALNESFISIALVNKLGLESNQLSKFNISIATGEYWQINTTDMFSWYAPVSLGSSADIHFFVPLDVFLEWFKEEAVKVSIMVQHNRDLLYSPYTPQKNLNTARNTRYFPSALDFELSTSGTSMIESFFQSHRNPQIASGFSLLFMIPPIVTGLIFGSLLTNLWYKQYLKIWNYFKPRGLTYNDFLSSYLLFAGLLAIIATPVAALIADFLENFVLIIMFGSGNAYWFSSFLYHIPFSLIIALTLAIWSKWKGVKSVRPYAAQEVKQELLKDKPPYPWAMSVFSLGIVGVCIPIILKSGFFQFSTMSLALEIWLGIFLTIFTVVTPITIIIGIAALISRQLPAIKESVNSILYKLRITGIKSVMGINRQRMGFFVVVAFAFQLFLTLAAVNVPHISYRLSYEMIGSSYATEYLDVDEKTAEVLAKTVMYDLEEEIEESWKYTRITGFNNKVGSRVELYRYNVSSMPIRYKASKTVRSLLLKASEEQRVILLTTGKDYQSSEITVKLRENQEVNFSLLDEKLALPGFINDEISTSTDLLFVPEPIIIQLLVPISINLSDYSFDEQIRIQFFSDNKSSDLVKSKIESVVFQQLGNWITIDYPEGDVDSQITFYIIETVIFSLFLGISFIILFISEISARKAEFGPYLCRGFSFRMLRIALLVEASIVVVFAAVFAWVVAMLLVFWLALMLQYSSLNPFVTPIFPLENQLVFLILVIFFIVCYSVTLKIIIKSGSLLQYMKQSY